MLLQNCSSQASRTSQARKLKQAAQNTIKALVGSSLSTVFRAWKQMKLSNYQSLVAKLHQREREYSELHELSESFFQCSREGSQRLKAMESAARAADRVLQKPSASQQVKHQKSPLLAVRLCPSLPLRIGAARADSLEAEAQALRRALPLGSAAGQRNTLCRLCLRGEAEGGRT